MNRAEARIRARRDRRLGITAMREAAYERLATVVWAADGRGLPPVPREGSEVIVHQDGEETVRRDSTVTVTVDGVPVAVIGYTDTPSYSSFAGRTYWITSESTKTVRQARVLLRLAARWYDVAMKATLMAERKLNSDLYYAMMSIVCGFEESVSLSEVRSGSGLPPMGMYLDPRTLIRDFEEPEEAP